MEECGAVLPVIRDEFARAERALELRKCPNDKSYKVGIFWIEKIFVFCQIFPDWNSFESEFFWIETIFDQKMSHFD